MRSDEGDPQRGYLHRVLADGVRPFRYRGGVSSLLGVSESEGRNLVLSRVLPPVGFRYAEHPVRVEPFRTQYPPSMTGNQAFYKEQVGEIEDRPSVSLGNVKTQESSIKHESETTTAGSRERRSVKPEAVAEKSSLEVPGVSEKRTYFGDVFHSSKGIRQSAGYEEQPHDLNKELTRWHQGQPYTKDEKDSALSRSESGATITGAAINGLQEKVSTKTKMVSSLPTEMHAAGKDATPGHTGTSAVEQVSKISSMPTFMAAPLANAQTMDSAINPIISPQRAIRNPEADIKMDLRGRPGIHKMNDLSTKNTSFSVVPQQNTDHFKSLNVSADAVEKSNQDASERIERLRHSLHELAAKGPSRQTVSKNEKASNTSEQAPLPIPQKVTIIHQPVVQNRVPRAFWERSYLSRFHLRLLR